MYRNFSDFAKSGVFQHNRLVPAIRRKREKTSKLSSKQTRNERLVETAILTS